MHLGIVKKYLTPKGLNVRTADKPVLVCVTWAHTIFRFFETFFEHASHSKLRGEKKCIIWTYGSKVMDVWSLKEKSGQGGHVLQPMRKSWPHVQNFVGKVVGQGGQGVDIVGHPRWGGHQPLVGATDRAPTSGRRPRVARDGRPPDAQRSLGRRPPVGRRPRVAARLYIQAATVKVADSTHFFNFFCD
jgi:hypothetical protein